MEGRFGVFMYELIGDNINRTDGRGRVFTTDRVFLEMAGLDINHTFQFEIDLTNTTLKVKVFSDNEFKGCFGEDVEPVKKYKDFDPEGYDVVIVETSAESYSVYLYSFEAIMECLEKSEPEGRQWAWQFPF